MLRMCTSCVGTAIEPKHFKTLMAEREVDVRVTNFTSHKFDETGPSVGILPHRSRGIVKL